MGRISMTDAESSRKFAESLIFHENIGALLYLPVIVITDSHWALLTE